MESRPGGQGGQKEIRIGLQLNYRLGDLWQSQIDPQAVAVARSLAGSRYDLVERNNHIVLEYQKQELIHLKMLGRIQGYAGEQKSLGVSVTSKYKLDRIEWDVVSLLAKGGKIILEAPERYSVLLPDYQSGDNAQNTYSINAIAYDKKGNASRRVLTEITVENVKKTAHSTAHIDSKDFSVIKNGAVADGVATNVVQVKLTDAQGNPLLKQPVEFTANNNAIIAASGTTDEKGELQMKLTSAVAGESEVTAKVGSTTQAVKVNFVADSSAARIALKIIKNDAVANGVDTNAVQATMTDVNGNPLSGQTVIFEFYKPTDPYDPNSSYDPKSPYKREENSTNTEGLTETTTLTSNIKGYIIIVAYVKPKTGKDKGVFITVTFK